MDQLNLMLNKVTSSFRDTPSAKSSKVAKNFSWNSLGCTQRLLEMYFSNLASPYSSSFRLLDSVSPSVYKWSVNWLRCSLFPISRKGSSSKAPKIVVPAPNSSVLLSPSQHKTGGLCPAFT